MLFCQRSKAQEVKVFCQKILPERWRFFVKNPEGLTLTDKPNELTLQLFLNF